MVDEKKLYCMSFLITALITIETVEELKLFWNVY